MRASGDVISVWRLAGQGHHLPGHAGTPWGLSTPSWPDPAHGRSISVADGPGGHAPGLAAARGRCANPRRELPGPGQPELGQYGEPVEIAVDPVHSAGASTAARGW